MRVQVREVALEAIARARRGDGPTLIECETYRYRYVFVCFCVVWVFVYVSVCVCVCVCEGGVDGVAAG